MDELLLQGEREYEADHSRYYKFTVTGTNVSDRTGNRRFLPILCRESEARFSFWITRPITSEKCPERGEFSPFT